MNKEEIIKKSKQTSTTLAKLPNKHYIANNKLANVWNRINGIIDGETFDLLVSGKDKKQKTKTRCILTYEGDNIDFFSKQPFTEYDRQVHDAIVSIYIGDTNNKMITAATVYRAMVNMTGSESPSPQQLVAVTKSIEKMRFVRVKLNCSEEIKKCKYKVDGHYITQLEFDENLIFLQSTTATIGGKKVKIYKIMSEPIIYKYSKISNQVITVDQKLLAIKDKNDMRIADTEDRIPIKGYLLRRIEIMKGPTKQSNHILFDTLFQMVGISQNNKQKAKRTRDYIRELLEFWEREKEIKGFSFIKNGKKFYSIKIMV